MALLSALLKTQKDVADGNNANLANIPDGQKPTNES